MNNLIPLRCIFIFIVFLIITSCEQKKDQHLQKISNIEKPLNIVVLLAPSGKGDKSYNDMAIDGINKAKNKYKITVKEVLPVRVDDYPGTIRRFSEDGADLIIAIGFLYVDAIAATAKNFINTRFVLIDGKIVNLKNVQSVVFRPQEASFLAGIAAGLSSKSRKIGFIAGMDIPIMQTFACGFREGVKYASKKLGHDIIVTERFIGSTPDAFSNPARGRDIARLMYKTGIDVIYHAAGASGNGIIQAAQETNKYVIGVDTDQSHLAPLHVLTSMRKRIDIAVENAITELSQNKFSDGLIIMRLNNGGVDVVRSTLISENIWIEVEKAKKELLKGSIDLCSQLNEN